MAERGEFRAIHTAIADDPGFLNLDTLERLMVLMLKLTLGQSGIAVMRATLPELVHLTAGHSNGIRRAFQRLQNDDWVRVEGHVIWLRNGLKYEPHIDLRNENHRKGVVAYLKSLPKCNLVNDFACYYQLDIPFPDLIPSPIPSEGDPPSHGDPIPNQGRGKRDEGRGMTDEGRGMTENGCGRSADADATAPVVENSFESFWEVFPKRQGSNSQPEARESWNGRVKDGIEPALLVAGARRYRAYCDAVGQTGSQFVMKAASFLGPKKRGWEETWEVSENGRKGRPRPQHYDYPEGTMEVPPWKK